jgi:hypothetical protein
MVIIFGLLLFGCSTDGAENVSGNIRFFISAGAALLMLVIISIICYVMGVENINYLFGLFGSLIAGIIVFLLFPFIIGFIGYITGIWWPIWVLIGIGVLIGFIFGGFQASDGWGLPFLFAIIFSAVGGGLGFVLKLILGKFGIL